MAKSKLGIKPLGKTVLVQLIKPKKRFSPSGLVLPESINEFSEQREATVVALGSGKIDGNDKYKFEVFVGDNVLVPINVGFRIERDDDTYVVLDENRIIAVID